MPRRLALRVLLGMAAVMMAVVQIGPTRAQPVAFAPGQVWSVRSTAPTPLRVVFGRIEPYGKGTVVHVSILDVPIPPGAPGAGGATRVAHMPFDEAALAASVDALVATGAAPLPNFEDGYRQWLSDRGGVWSLTVSEAIAVVFQGLT